MGIDNLNKKILKEEDKKQINKCMSYTKDWIKSHSNRIMAEALFQLTFNFKKTSITILSYLLTLYILVPKVIAIITALGI
jgi:hypothetical protein